MPTVFKVYKKKYNPDEKKNAWSEVGDLLYSCCVNTKGKASRCSKCQQCTGITSRGQRCKLKTCLDSKFCYIHLLKYYKVAIKPSRIAHGGLGLFCLTDKKPKAADKGQAIFKKGDIIVPYGGKLFTDEKLNDIYDYKLDDGTLVEPTAPYAILGPEGFKRDAACVRQAGAYANDEKGSATKKNARLTSAGYLEATRPIYKGDEILVSYGAQYWKDSKKLETRSRKVSPHKKAIATGCIGRYVNKHGVYVDI